MKKILSLILALSMLLSMVAVASAAEITDYRTYQTAANEMPTMPQVSMTFFIRRWSPDA